MFANGFGKFGRSKVNTMLLSKYPVLSVWTNTGKTGAEVYFSDRPKTIVCVVVLFKKHI